MITTTSSQNVLAKLLELQMVHKKVGKEHEYFGVDTLSMLFNITHSKMMSLLGELEAMNEVRLSANTTGVSRSGKNQIWFVSLCH